MNINYIEGDLISLAKSGNYDAVVYGMNCFNDNSTGLAKQMKDAFYTTDYDMFPLEQPRFKGDINKLGQLDFYEWVPIGNKLEIAVIKAYVMFSNDLSTKPFDQVAFMMCLIKLNKLFAGKNVIMPEIGGHLAGANWTDKLSKEGEYVPNMLTRFLPDVQLTVVKYKP